MSIPEELKPREFWLKITQFENIGMAGFRYSDCEVSVDPECAKYYDDFKNAIHVIEYSAYEDLKKQFIEMHNNTISINLHQSRMWNIQSQLSAKEAEIVKLREALEIANEALDQYKNIPVEKVCGFDGIDEEYDEEFVAQEAQEKIKLLIEGE